MLESDKIIFVEFNVLTTKMNFDSQIHGGMITGGLIRKRVLSMTSSRGTAHKKLK